MWGNVVNAFSNLYGLVAVYYFLEKGYILPGILHLLWVIFATTYHLVETGVHDMPGILRPPAPLPVQSLLNYLTLIFSLASAITWPFYLLVIDVYVLSFGILGITCLLIPEILTQITGRPYRNVYQIFHPISHILIFCIPKTISHDDPIIKSLVK
jgi:hypothetical protein